MNKKIMSVLMAAAISASLITAPVHANAETQMKVSTPKYYHVVATKDVNGYDAFEEVESLTDGKFTDTVSWGDGGRVLGSLTGTFKTEVDVADGAAKNVTLYGAVYDADGRLVSVASDKKATADATDKLSVTVDVDADQTFQNFIWDVEGGLKPITVQDKAPTIRYFYCDDPNTVTVAWYNEGGNYTVEKNGVAVDAEFATLSTDSQMNFGRYPLYVYTDASAQTGDKYVVKNNGVAADELVADFTEGAYVTIGKYLVGRNMAYMRNNEQWYNSSISDPANVEGRYCDVAAYKQYEAGGESVEKWTYYLFKVDQDYISGSGNAVDVTIDYFDAGSGSVRIKYIPDSTNTSAESGEIKVADLTGTNTWKTATYRLTNASFLAETPVDGTWQLRVLTDTGSAIGKVAVAPYVDTTIQTLRAANTYTDGVEVRWTVASESGITGYTVKRNGEVIATNYQKRTYYDKGLDANTTYTYTVTAETANGFGTESEVLTATTSKVQEVSMTLPLVEGYDGSGEPSTAITQYTDGNGLTFGLVNNDRWNEGMSLARQKAGKWGRMTVCRNTSYPQSGPNWWEVYTWDYSTKAATYLSFQVDNNIISADTKNITVEFEYYDNPDLSGQTVEMQYLNDNGGKNTKRISYGATGTWKTAKFQLTDAQFDHRSGGLQGGYSYDFRLSSGGNRGGLTVTWVKVYATDAVPMPEHEIYSVVNAAGTALEGKLEQSIWTGSYDRNIGFSGNNAIGLSAVEGKQYTFNYEYTDDGGSWRRWKNAWFYKIPDDFLYGTDYEDLKIAVEYYLPSDDIGLKIITKNASDGSDHTVWAKNSKHVWETHVFEYKDGSSNFAGGFDSTDFKFEINGQGYIHKVTITKDVIED